MCLGDAAGSARGSSSEVIASSSQTRGTTACHFLTEFCARVLPSNNRLRRRKVTSESLDIRLTCILHSSKRRLPGNSRRVNLIAEGGLSPFLSGSLGASNKNNSDQEDRQGHPERTQVGDPFEIQDH